METLKLKAVIDEDRRLRIEVPTSLPPGPADVVVTIRTDSAPSKPFRWADCCGLGKEIWAGQDAQAYVDRLRDEWER